MSRIFATLLVLFASDGAAAQLRRQTAPVLVPGALLSAPDDASAIDVNPAALPFLDGFGLVYVHADAGDGTFAREGDALRWAQPLPLGLAVGASVQSVRPAGPGSGSSYGVAALGLGYADEGFGIGGTVRWHGSGDATIHGLTTLDLAATWRPAPSLALSLLARDVNGPLRLAGIDLPASFVLAVGLRPSGTNVFTLDLGGAIDTDGRIGIRGAAHLAVPYVGRLIASAELDGLEGNEEALLVAGGLEVSWGGIGAGGGVIAGDGFGDTPGWYASVRLEGASRSGIPLPRYVADVEIRGVDERSLLSTIARLDRLITDDRVAGVLLRFRSTGMGTAYAQELRLMIDALEAAGKPVVCHLDAGSGTELYACAAATRTYLDPAGGVRLAGPHVEVLLFGEALRDLGVRAEFVRIGRYKSAPEQFTNVHSSDHAREQRVALYDSVYDRLIVDLARDYEIPRRRARELVDGGPYVTPEAVALGLVAGSADELDMDRTLEDAFGERYPRLASSPASVRPRWAGGTRVGVVVVDGDIVDGDNVDIPILELRMSGGRTITRAIDRMASDPSIGAIVLRIDSPGGSALASDQIWRAVMRARRRKPVVASMGAIAASGGYYVAAAADEIWANPSTVTGSIGIFFGKVDFAPLADRIGVTIEHYGRGRHAGLESIYRPFTPAERHLIAEKIRIWYRLFLRRIATGRRMDIDAIHEVAEGRVWSGDDALRIGLVDRIGGFGGALRRARELAGLPSDAPTLVVPVRPYSVLDFVLGPGDEQYIRADGTDHRDAPSVGALPAELRAVLEPAAAFGYVREGVPLARMDSIVVVE